VKLAQRGLAAKEIARQLGISKRTVEAHLGEARRRVGVASTVALVGSVIVGADATDRESSYSCSENAGISEQVITGGGVPSPPRRDRQRRGRPTVMTDDMIAKARVLLLSYSISDIARHLKVSRTTIYAHMGQIRGMGELHARGPPLSTPHAMAVTGQALRCSMREPQTRLNPDRRQVSGLLSPSLRLGARTAAMRDPACLSAGRSAGRAAAIGAIAEAAHRRIS
jgi:DNA-binding CsgD family transcriptional regulator